jgi:hypothetical protein
MSTWEGMVQESGSRPRSLPAAVSFTGTNEESGALRARAR